MPTNDSKGSGDSGKQRSPVRSSVRAREPAPTAAENSRGDMVGKGGRGPTELPAQFGRYRVKKKLGGGGMGTVYLVHNTELEREEALKVPHFGDGDDAHARERFLREAKSAAKLDHANLCPVWDAGVLDGVYYLTMRFLKGKLLSDYTDKAQPARKAVEIVAILARALEAAHDKGVIHRDLKPANVMMISGVGPVVMDFGLAKEVQKPDQKLTAVGSMLGTPSYMPPEQVQGKLDGMGPASDVYSLGVILYELLTGRLPFEGTMAMIFGQILYTEPPLPSKLVPGLDPILNGICQKAMAKAPEDRYPSMNAFAAALQDFLRSTPPTDGTANLARAAGDKAAGLESRTVAPRPPAAATVTSRRVKASAIATKRSRHVAKRWMNPWLAAGACLALGLPIIAIVFWVGRDKTEQQEPAVQQELDDPSDPFKVKSVWVGDNVRRVFTVTKRKGDDFTATLEIIDSRYYIEREVTGTIVNGSISWLDKDVRIVRARGTGGTGGDHYGTVRSDDSGDRIDFTWQHPSGASGTFTLRLTESN